MIEQITQNWICWAILSLALMCYYQISLRYLLIKELQNQEGLPSDEIDYSVDNNSESHLEINQKFTAVLIGALPLLGLLGTIIGLLECFAGIASEGANSELVSGGIADALLTTQLGLVCAIPAWLLQSYVRSIHRQSSYSIAEPYSR